MTDKQDLRVLKSKKLIKKAFLELMEEKGFANITVTDIAEKAMINRKTFYMHYETKEILYNSICDEFFNLASPALEGLQNLKGKDQRIYAVNLLHRFKENKDIFRVLLNDNTNADFMTRLKNKLKYDLVSKSHIDEKTKGTNFTTELLTEAYFSIFMTFAKWWLENSDKVSENQLVDMIIEFFSKKTLEILGISFDN